MCRLLLLLTLLVLVPTSVLWTADAPVFRAGITATAEEATLATALISQGWVYVMPAPKSPQAAWGNADGRTTWWMGYWSNQGTHHTSSSLPIVGDDGQYHGDDRGFRAWRRGGSPQPPSRLEWLCSVDGGIRPR